MKPEFDFAAAQIIGGRKYQEDRFLLREIQDTYEGDEASEGSLLAVIADGMGGHVAGGLAAELAINAFVESACENDGRVSDGFLAALDAGNRAIATHIATEPDKRGMGCTLLGVEYKHGNLRWISVGDSILYRCREDELSRLNANHSLALQLDAAAERGEITREDAQNSSSRHMLTSAVTGEKIDRVDFAGSFVKTKKGDWYLLASDGLVSLKNAEIVKTIRDNKNSSARKICSLLLDAVDKRDSPSQDNTTLVVIRAGEFTEIPIDDVPTRPIRSR